MNGGLIDDFLKNHECPSHLEVNNIHIESIFLGQSHSSHQRDSHGF